MELIALDSSGNKNRGIATRDLCFMHWTIACLNNEYVPITISRVGLKCVTGKRFIHGIAITGKGKVFPLKVVETKLPLYVSKGQIVNVIPINVHENPGEVRLEISKFKEL